VWVRIKARGRSRVRGRVRARVKVSVWLIVGWLSEIAVTERTKAPNLACSFLCIYRIKLA